MTGVVIADTNALYRLLNPGAARHQEHRNTLAGISHLVVPPPVLVELDYLVTTKVSAHAARTALGFVARNVESRRFEIPDVAPHLRSAMAVMEGYPDADQGGGVGLTDALNVALAAEYQTATLFTTDGHFRMMRPLTGHTAFRLLPDDS